MLLETFLSSRVTFFSSINGYGILWLTAPKGGWIPGTKWRRRLQWLQNVCCINVMNYLNVRPVLRFTFWIRFTPYSVMIKSKTSLQSPIYLLQLPLPHLINRNNPPLFNQFYNSCLHYNRVLKMCTCLPGQSQQWGMVLGSPFLNHSTSIRYTLQLYNQKRVPQRQSLTSGTALVHRYTFLGDPFFSRVYI